jgi:hypothetical protein
MGAMKKTLSAGAALGSVSLLEVLLAACSSDESTTASSCLDLASCYTMTMTVPASAPAECSPGKSAEVPRTGGS